MPSVHRIRAWHLRISALCLLTAAACGAPDAGRDPDLDLHRGRNALADGRFEWARLYFAADLERHPERLESLRGLGIAWAEGDERSLTRAAQLFRRYLELEPTDIGVVVRLARIGSWLGEPQGVDAVLDALEAPLLERGEEAPVEALILRARAGLDADPERAGALIREALSRPLAPARQAAVAAAAAEILARLGEDDQAEAQARRSLALDPLRSELHYLRARLARRRGAAAAAREALAVWDLLRHLPRDARAAPRATGPGNALEVSVILEDLATHLPAAALPWRILRCRLLLDRQPGPEARSLLDELTTDPDLSAASAVELGRAAQAAGWAARAQRLYERAIEEGSGAPVLTGLAEAAFLAAELGDRDHARGLVEHGLELDEHHAPFHFIAGWIALSEGRDADAHTSLARAVELAPWQARYRLTLADVHLAAGEEPALRALLDAAPRPDRAVEAYRKRHLSR